MLSNGVRKSLFTQEQKSLIENQIETEERIILRSPIGFKYDGGIEYLCSRDGYSKLSDRLPSVSNGINGNSVESPYHVHLDRQRVMEILQKAEIKMEIERRRFEIITAIEDGLKGFGTIRIDYNELRNAEISLDEFKKAQKLLDRFFCDYTKKMGEGDYTHFPHVEGKFRITDGRIDLTTRYVAYSDLREVVAEDHEVEEE